MSYYEKDKCNNAVQSKLNEIKRKAEARMHEDFVESTSTIVCEEGSLTEMSKAINSCSQTSYSDVLRERMIQHIIDNDYEEESE